MGLRSVTSVGNSGVPPPAPPESPTPPDSSTASSQPPAAAVPQAKKKSKKMPQPIRLPPKQPLPLASAFTKLLAGSLLLVGAGAAVLYVKPEWKVICLA